MTGHKTLFQLSERIKFLEDQLSREISVKRSEKMYNEDLQEIIKIKDMSLETLAQVNDMYAKRIVKLEKKLEKFMKEE